MSSTRTTSRKTPRTSPRKTLWEEGRHPGRLVRTVTAVACLLVAAVETLVNGHLGVLFDVAFVLLCVAAALAVRPRDFFLVGVLPPLLMLGTVTLFAVVARDAVADPRDGVVQGVVSGLAHHAGALVLGYGLVLVLLAVRQVAVRNAGVIRGPGRARIPQQRQAAREPVRH